MARVSLITFTILLYASLFGGSFLFWQGPLEINRPKEDGSLTGQGKFQAALIPPKLQEEKPITLLFVGDIMLDRGVEFYAKERQDWKWPFLKIADTLRKADLVFANLESVISDKGTKQGSIYSFRADPRTMKGMAFAGIDAVSVANNHSLDYGANALLDSIQRLKDAGIAPVGGGANKTEAHAPTVLDAQDTTVAILAYTQVGSPLWQAGPVRGDASSGAGEHSPGIAWMDNSRLATLKEDIEAAQKRADLVVVSFHYGDEYQPEPNAVQRLLSTSAIDYGANLVVGHHPHVVGAVEQYKQGWIAWSLGNFVFDQGFSKETMEGLLLKVLIKEKSITEVMPIPIEISSQFQPAISNESI